MKRMHRRNFLHSLMLKSSGQKALKATKGPVLLAPNRS